MVGTHIPNEIDIARVSSGDLVPFDRGESGAYVPLGYMVPHVSECAHVSRRLQ